MWEQEQREALEQAKTELARDRERMETERKQQQQETKEQREQEQKDKEEQARQDSEIADAAEMVELVQNVLAQSAGVEPNAPGMTNVCVSAGCKQQKKKRCTFGMCIDCCKLRPGAGTLNGKCKLGTHYPD